MLTACLPRSLGTGRAFVCFIAFGLVLIKESSAFEDPVVVSVDGITISSVPDFIIVSSGNPEEDWIEFCDRPGVIASREGSTAKRLGIFAASRHSSFYLFANPSHVARILPNFEHEFSSSAIIYCFSPESERAKKELIRAGKLRKVGKKLESGSLYVGSRKDRYVWVMDASAFPVCPMHPLQWTGGTRCPICEMPKVPLEQIPTIDISDSD